VSHPTRAALKNVARKSQSYDECIQELVALRDAIEKGSESAMIAAVKKLKSKGLLGHDDVYQTQTPNHYDDVAVAATRQTTRTPQTTTARRLTDSGK
jgi:hypothetical protein